MYCCCDVIIEVLWCPVTRSRWDQSCLSWARHIQLITSLSHPLQRYICLTSIMVVLDDLFPPLFTQTTPTLAGGKQLTLKEPVRLSEIVQRVKVHLQLPFVRVASPQFQEDPIIKTVAACPGSGGSVLEKVGVDLLLTGEMSHHQVLAATGRGVAVLLCEHSNTERGYLQTLYKSKLEQVFADSVHVVIPKLDHDPLQIV